MVVIGYSVVISIVLSLFWPVVQTGINNFGIWIANSSETSPVLAPFIYGTLERLLLPFGLHHMLTISMNYTSSAAPTPSPPASMQAARYLVRTRCGWHGPTTSSTSRRPVTWLLTTTCWLPLPPPASR